MGLQMHWPVEQIWPAAHCVFAPQRHMPAAQVSLLVASHITQGAPPLPHDISDAAVQVLPAQQPFAHELALHTHWPPMHAWPAPQALPAPHLQAPMVQLSVLVESHSAQAIPPRPHVI